MSDPGLADGAEQVRHHAGKREQALVGGIVHGAEP